MAKTFHNCLLPNTCGVAISSLFRVNEASAGGTKIENLISEAGCGWHCAGFTPESGAYKQAYEELKLKWKIVYQTPVRINTRTNNRFIFVVYDTKSKMGPIRRAEHNAQFEWTL